MATKTILTSTLLLVGSAFAQCAEAARFGVVTVSPNNVTVGEVSSLQSRYKLTVTEVN